MQQSLALLKTQNRFKIVSASVSQETRPLRLQSPLLCSGLPLTSMQPTLMATCHAETFSSLGCCISTSCFLPSVSKLKFNCLLPKDNTQEKVLAGKGKIIYPGGWQPKKKVDSCPRPILNILLGHASF